MTQDASEKNVAALPGFDLQVRFDPSRNLYIITSPQFPELYHATSSGILGLEAALDDVPAAIQAIIRRRA